MCGRGEGVCVWKGVDLFPNSICTSSDSVHSDSRRHVGLYWQMLRSGDVPLKDQVLKSSNLSVPPVSLSRCPDTYKHWTDVQIDKALDAVQKKTFTVQRAAEEFGVPKSTLHDRISGRVQVGGHSGPSKYLSDEEEDELEEFLVGAAAVGYARSRQQVIQLVQDVTRKGLAVHVSHGWWNSFKRCHPKLTTTQI